MPNKLNRFKTGGRRLCGTRLLRVAIAVVSVGMSGALCGRAWAEEFHHDFGKGGGEGAAMRLEGQKANQYVERTPGGLVISLPERKSLLDAVGVLPKFAVRGDFEITASYEIMELEPPTVGYGAGVSLRVLTDASAHDGATVARFCHPKQSQVFTTDHAADRSRGDRSHDGKTFPAEKMSGKLRLARQGTTLHYLVADDDSDTFRELASTEFVADDVTSVRVAADPGRSKVAMKVRLIDFDVRADALPLTVGRTTAPFVWIIWSVASLAALVAVGAVVARARRTKPKG